MNVLVTGSSGRIGAAATRALTAAGHVARTFDLVDDQDVRDLDVLTVAMAGCDVVVHCAAITHDTLGTPEDIRTVNVDGTQNVLTAAEQVGVRRVVVLSSVQVFGCSDGEGQPDHLPIDDAHPRRAARAYGLSKRLVEDRCEEWSARTGVPTIALRPTAVRTDAELACMDVAAMEHGSIVRLEDVAAAIALAVHTPVGPHTRAILSATGDFDSSVALTVLGWRPRRPARRWFGRRALTAR